MRVLILADDCNPQWPSLPIVAYKAIRAVAEHADVVVATHVRNKENIDAAGFGRAQVQYIDNEYIARPMYKVATILRGGTRTAWTTAVALAYPSYLAFEREVWKRNRDDLRQGKFDLVHRITPMSPTLPSPIASWTSVPFILGPLNGGLKWPSGFGGELIREREWLSYARSAYRLLPYYRATYAKSKAVLAAFAHTAADLPESARPHLFNYPEVGIDPEIFGRPSVRQERKEKIVLFAGRLVPYKLPLVAIGAFASSSVLRSHRLVIAGDGPERGAMEALIDRHGLAGQVEMLGWKSQWEIAELMRKADIFAFPSIRELGAGVVVEAMVAGLACVVVEYGGPATLIEADRGVKVQLGSKEQLIERFARELESLVSDPARITRLGLAAREHAMHHYTWDKKALKLMEVYKWAVGQGPRPSYDLI